MLLCWLLSGKQTPFLIKNVSFDMPVQRGEAIELCDNKKGTNLDCRCVENRIYNKTHGLQKCKKIAGFDISSVADDLATY